MAKSLGMIAKRRMRYIVGSDRVEQLMEGMYITNNLSERLHCTMDKRDSKVCETKLRKNGMTENHVR